MKLKTKLIPLVGVATLCATVAPIALTSCEQTTDGINLLEQYKPSYERLDYQDEGMTYLEGIKSWVEQLQVDPNRFIEEYYWSMSHNVVSINRVYKQDAYVKEAAVEEAKKKEFEIFETLAIGLSGKIGAFVPESSVPAVLAKSNLITKDIESFTNFNIEFREVEIEIPDTPKQKIQIPFVSFEHKYSVERLLNYKRNKELLYSNAVSIDTIVEEGIAHLTNIPFIVIPQPSVVYGTKTWQVTPLIELLTNPKLAKRQGITFPEGLEWSIGTQYSSIDYTSNSTSIIGASSGYGMRVNCEYSQNTDWDSMIATDEKLESEEYRLIRDLFFNPMCSSYILWNIYHHDAK